MMVPMLDIMVLLMIAVFLSRVEYGRSSIDLETVVGISEPKSSSKSNENVVLPGRNRSSLFFCSFPSARNTFRINLPSGVLTSNPIRLPGP